jgi:hypothetical protein
MLVHNSGNPKGDRDGERPPCFEIGNLEDEYFNAKIGVSKRTNGCKHGEKHMH